MGKGIKLVALMAGVVLLSGCSMRIVDFTAISTKNVDIQSLETGNRVVGQDCAPIFLVPLGVPNMKTAIDRAIENAGPGYDALIDGVVYNLNQSFLIGRVCYRVEGTPIQTRKVVAKK